MKDQLTNFFRAVQYSIAHGYSTIEFMAERANLLYEPSTAQDILIREENIRLHADVLNTLRIISPTQAQLLLLLNTLYRVNMHLRWKDSIDNHNCKKKKHQNQNQKKNLKTILALAELGAFVSHVYYNNIAARFNKIDNDNTAERNKNKKTAREYIEHFQSNYSHNADEIESKVKKLTFLSASKLIEAKGKLKPGKNIDHNSYKIVEAAIVQDEIEQIVRHCL